MFASLAFEILIVVFIKVSKNCYTQSKSLKIQYKISQKLLLQFFKNIENTFCSKFDKIVQLKRK